MIISSMFGLLSASFLDNTDSWNSQYIVNQEYKCSIGATDIAR